MNPADICTKNVTQAQIDAALEMVNMKISEGRAQESLKVNSIQSTIKPHKPDSDVANVAARQRVSWADLQEEEESRNCAGATCAVHSKKN